MVGGGSMPIEKIPTYVIKVKSDKYKPEELEVMLRKNKVPIIVRVSNDEVIMDIRTMFDEDFNAVAETFSRF